MSNDASPSPRADAILTSSASDWRYLSEGKQHIVFAFEGGRNKGNLEPTSTALLAGRVLKLSKSVLLAAQSNPLPSRTALVERLSLTHRYTSRVIRPIFAATDREGDPPSSDWFEEGEILWYPAYLAAELLQKAFPLRPETRIRQFDLFNCPPRRDGGFQIPVVLLEDYTSPLHLHLKQAASAQASSPLPPSLPPTICIELKPKWGFLPSHSSSPEKLSICRFCMHQYTKLVKGEVREHSHFCPLDLFSCEERRVARAVEELFRTPQNNLRIFVRASHDNGATDSQRSSTKPSHVEQLDMSEEAHVNRLTHILFPHLGATQILPKSNPATVMYDQRELLKEFLVRFICAPFGLVRSMLHRLSHLQAKLDAWDIERVWPAVETFSVINRYEQRRKEEQLQQQRLCKEDELAPDGNRINQQHHDDVRSVVPASLSTNGFSSPSSHSTSGQLVACGPAPERPPATFAGLHPLLESEPQDQLPCVQRSRLWKGVLPTRMTQASLQKDEPTSDSPMEEESIDWISNIIAMVKSDQNHNTSSSPASSYAALSSAPSSSGEASSSHRLFEFQSKLQDPRIGAAAADQQHAADSFPVCAIQRARAATAPAAAASVAHPDSDAFSSVLSPLQLVDEQSVSNTLRAFLISTTLKDVSLMCTLQPITVVSEGVSAPPHPLSTRVHYSARLIDLELKSVGKLREYFTMDREIVEEYRKHTSRE